MRVLITIPGDIMQRTNPIHNNIIFDLKKRKWRWDDWRDDKIEMVRFIS